MLLWFIASAGMALSAVESADDPNGTQGRLLMETIKNQAKNHNPDASPMGNSGGTFSGWPDAIAGFIVDRVQTELASSVLLSVQDELSKNAEPHLNALFKKTATAIENLKAVNLSRTGIGIIQTAFRADLDAISENLADWKKAVVEDPATPTAIKSALAGDGLEIAAAIGGIYYRLRHGDSLSTVLGEILRQNVSQSVISNIVDNAAKLSSANAETAQSLKLNAAHSNPTPAAILMACLAYTYLISDANSDISKVDHKAAMKNFMSLFYDKDANKIPAYLQALMVDTIGGMEDKTSVDKVLDGLMGKCLESAQALAVFLSTNKITLNSIAKSPGNPESTTMYLQLEEKIQAWIATALPIAAAFESAVANSSNADPLKAGPWKEFTTAWNNRLILIGSIHVDLIQKDFTGAALDAVILASQFAPKYLDVTAANYIAIAGQFAAAKSPADKTAFLNTIADPASDFLNKRMRGGWYLTVNGYLGGSYGVERLQGAPSNVWNRYYGVSAPVGLEFGRGITCLDDCITSIGVLGTIINVGNIATEQIQSQNSENNTVSNSNTSISKVMAPGAFLIIGITKKYPVSLGLGVEHVNDIRQDAAGRNLPGTHWSAFLGIDVPILSLWQ